MLDSRAPMAQIEAEKRQDETVDKEVEKLLMETRHWRTANSAQWVAWGIVQAKVPGMDEALKAQKTSTPKSEGTITQAPQAHLGSHPLSLETRKPCQNDEEKRPEGSKEVPNEGLGKEEEAEDEEEEEDFDYLGYAQERAMLFWGDVLQLGIVKREDLPKELLEKVKVVEY